MKLTPEEWAKAWENMDRKVTGGRGSCVVSDVGLACVICGHLKLEQRGPAILREGLFEPLVHPRILPPEEFHRENLVICDECWEM